MACSHPALSSFSAVCSVIHSFTTRPCSLSSLHRVLATRQGILPRRGSESRQGDALRTGATPSCDESPEEKEQEPEEGPSPSRGAFQRGQMGVVQE